MAATVDKAYAKWVSALRYVNAADCPGGPRAPGPAGRGTGGRLCRPLDRRVRWVHVSEVGNMSNLLEGGELVLTTGLALLDEQHRDAYLPGLAAAGAVGCDHRTRPAYR